MLTPAYGRARDMLLALVLTLLPAALACPCYTLTPSRTNYTLVSVGASTALNVLHVPLHVCDGANVSAAEVFPTLNGNFALIGDVSPTTGEAALLTFLSSGPGPLILVTANAFVTVSTLQIAFNNTLFAVQNTALLEVTNCDFWIGNTAVLVQTSSAAPDVGFTGEFIQFGNLGIPIYAASGRFSCTACVFNSPRVSAVSVPSTLFTAYSLEFCFWFNTPVYINVQPTPSAPPVPLALPANWGRLNSNFKGPSYVPNCVLFTPVPSPSAPAGNLSGSGSGFGTSGGAGGGHTASFRNWQLGLIVATLLLLVAIAFINIYATTNRAR
jgi:hypothetical protein